MVVESVEGEGHNDIYKELKEAGRERMLALLLGSLTLINETATHTKRRAEIRREGWHWYSRPHGEGESDSCWGKKLRKSPGLHC